MSDVFGIKYICIPNTNSNAFGLTVLTTDPCFKSGSSWHTSQIGLYMPVWCLGSFM